MEGLPPHQDCTQEDGGTATFISKEDGDGHRNLIERHRIAGRAREITSCRARGRTTVRHFLAKDGGGIVKGANFERNALQHNLITLPTMRCRAQNPEVVELVVCHLLRQVDVPSRQRIPSTGARDHITWMITPWAPSTGARDHIKWLITPWFPQPLPRLFWDPLSLPRVGVLGGAEARCLRSVRVARCLRWCRRCFRLGARSATIIAIIARQLH